MAAAPHPQPELVDTISFDVHALNKNDSFASGIKDRFYADLINANQFGFEYVSCTNNQNKYDFGINMCFYNNADLTGTDVQGNKGTWITPPNAMYGLNLLGMLDATDDYETLIKRDLVDKMKDLTCAKIRVSMNGAKEILRKFAKDVYREDLLNKTLDELLNTFKYGLPPSPEQITIKGVLSRGGKHNFTIPEKERGAYQLAYRDSGPRSDTVDPNFTSEVKIMSNNSIVVLLNRANGIINNKITQYTIGNHKDPASNVTTDAWMSCLFNNFKPSFYSPFIGSTTDKLSLGLYTRRTKLSANPVDNHKLFVCDVEIIHKTTPPPAARDARLYTTHIEYNNVLCDMTKTTIAGFKSMSDGSTNHKYSTINGDVTQIAIGPKTSKAFFDDIAGNNNKNSFFLNYMNKLITDTKKAEGLSKLSLKAAGDPDQVLVILQEILNYALLRFKAYIIECHDSNVLIEKSLHFFFVDTLKKYLLITCDGVLAALARRLMLSYVLQQNNSIIYVKYGDTSEEVKALSIFCSMKEKLKKELENYMSLLSTTRVTTLNILNKDGSIFPVTSKTGGGVNGWCNLDENIKLLNITIQKHFNEIESLSSTVVSDVTPEKTAQLTRISHLYNIPIITKTTKMTLNGSKLNIYHLNYLQSLTLLLSSGFDINDFLFCTKITNNDTNARTHPDFVGCITAYNLLSPRRAASPPPPPPQSASPAQSPAPVQSASPAPSSPVPSSSSSSSSASPAFNPDRNLSTGVGAVSPPPKTQPPNPVSRAPDSASGGQMLTMSSAPAKVEQSLFEEYVCRDNIVSDVLNCSTAVDKTAAVKEAAAAAAAAAQEISAKRSIAKSATRLTERNTSTAAKPTDELTATKLNDKMRITSYNTRSTAARALATMCKLERHTFSVGRRLGNMGGGGKSHKSIVQKGGCQEPNYDNEFFPMDNLYGLLGDKAICEWVNHLSTEREKDTKIYIDCNRIINGNDSHQQTYGVGFNILSVELPYIQYYLFALLSDDSFAGHLEKFLRFIAGQQQVGDPVKVETLSLYDMVQEYILMLKCNSKITDETHRTREAVAAAAAAAAVVCARKEAKAVAAAVEDVAAAAKALTNPKDSDAEFRAVMASRAQWNAEAAMKEEVKARTAEQEGETISTDVVEKSIAKAVTMEDDKETRSTAMVSASIAKAEDKAAAAQKMDEDEELKKKRVAEELAAKKAFINVVTAAEKLETEALQLGRVVLKRNPTICRHIESFITSQIAEPENLYHLCKLIDSVDNNEKYDIDYMPVEEPYGKSKERAEEYIFVSGNDEDKDNPDGGGGGCKQTIRPNFSLERFGEGISCIFIDGRRFEAASLPLKLKDEDDDDDTSILSLLRDLENTTTVRMNGDDNCKSLLNKKIIELIPIVCDCITKEVAVAAAEAVAEHKRAKATPPAAVEKATPPPPAAVENAAISLLMLYTEKGPNKDERAATRVASLDPKAAVGAKAEMEEAAAARVASFDPKAAVGAKAEMEKAAAVAVAMEKAARAAVAAKAARDAAAKAASSEDLMVSNQDSMVVPLLPSSLSEEMNERGGSAAGISALPTAEAFTEAEQTLRGLNLESRTDRTEFTAFLCRCGAAFVAFVDECNISLQEDLRGQSFRYITAAVVSECSVPFNAAAEAAAEAGAGARANEMSDPEDPEDPATVNAARMKGKILEDAKNMKEGVDESQLGGGRRPVKKSTHRKPRRHTRNYQSRNKHKRASSAKTTIKHRKSYRKYKHTVKRRKIRRHH